MTKENGERRFPSWKYIVGVLIPVLTTLAIWLYTDTRADIKNLNQMKADKVDITRLEGKIDKIYDFLLNRHR